MILDRRRLTSILPSVGVLLALAVPFFAYTWFLCSCVREAKRSWSYIEV